MTLLQQPQDTRLPEPEDSTVGSTERGTRDEPEATPEDREETTPAPRGGTSETPDRKRPGQETGRDAFQHPGVRDPRCVLGCVIRFPRARSHLWA